MHDLLYLLPDYKKFLQNEIKRITECFLERLFPIFNNIGKESNEYSQKLLNNTFQSVGDYNFDPSDAAEYATEKGIEYYQALSVAKYGFTAFSISLLYHFWEQQIRKFLFWELKKNDYEIDFKKFTKNIYNIKDIKDFLLLYDINIEKFDSWDKLDELRLLNNAVKHGTTKNLSDLKEKNSGLFHSWVFKDDETLKHIDSCILEEILNISEANFKEYSDVLINFWEEFPERSYRK